MDKFKSFRADNAAKIDDKYDRCLIGVNLKNRYLH